MGRYRPPANRPSAYVTKQGFDALQDEARGLWVKRREVTIALAAAAAEGDRSENAEYIYRKKELREIDRRIRYLQKRLPELKVVDGPPADHQRVFFGAWVTVADDDGLESTYRIVGPDEIDPQRGWISMDAPLAKALLGQQSGAEVSVTTPQGRTHYRLVSLEYQHG